MRVAFSAAIVLALVGVAGAVRAEEPDKARCVDAYDKSQRLRREGKLMAAHAELLVCSNASCPNIVQAECAKWLTEVENGMPSIVLEAQDGDGKQLTNVHVWVDGTEASLTGRAMEVDPGEHVVRFRRDDDGTTSEQRAVVIEGQKLQKVTAVLGQPTPREPERLPPPRRVRAAPGVPFWIVSSIGVVALGVGGVLDVTGWAQEQNMLSTCAPACDPGQVSDMRTRVLIGDVSLGVGIAAVATATILFFTRGWTMTRAAVFLLPTGIAGRF